MLRTVRRGGPWLVVGLALATVGCDDLREAAENRFDPATPGTLVVGAEVPTPGFWEGTPHDVTGGFELQLAQALADELGLQLEVVQVPFTDVVAGRLGPADLALQEVSVTNERSEAVEFSVPYLTTSPTVVARDDGGDAADLRDLATAGELHWAVRGGTTEDEFLRQVVQPDQDTLQTGSVKDALAAVERRTVDAALVDVSDALLADAGSDELVAVARFDRSEDVAAVLPRGATRNVTAVDEALRALGADGTIDRLIDTWLTSAYPVDPTDLPVIVTR
jgi:polar amino acid transport system substrate-binding protein